MAEEKKKLPRVRKVETMRDKATKAEGQSAKPRRLKKTASAVKKPIKAMSVAAKKEYHLITPQDGGFKGFLTKSRRITPRYFSEAYKELKRVTWPNRRETWRLMDAVFLFATIFGLLITVVDYGLDKLFKQAFL
jgi:preprotein translocase SecE subunit